MRLPAVRCRGSIGLGLGFRSLRGRDGVLNVRVTLRGKGSVQCNLGWGKPPLASISCHPGLWRWLPRAESGLLSQPGEGA